MSIDLFLKYLQYEKNYSPLTISSYKNDLSHFVEYVDKTDDAMDIRHVDSDIIRNYVVSLMSGGITARSVGRKLSALRTFYKYLIKEGEVLASPVEGVHKPKGKHRLPVFARPEDMDLLIDGDTAFDDTFCGVRNRLIISMLYQTGIRRAELISLKDADIDLSAATLKVTGKRNKQRIVPYGEELKSEIGSYIQIRDKTILAPEAFLVRENGCPLYPMLVQRIVTSALGVSTTLAKRSPHVLRHTFASAMLNNGADINSVKELLGHSSLASTQVYTHITFEELKNSYNKALPRAVKKGG